MEHPKRKKRRWLWGGLGLFLTSVCLLFLVSGRGDQGPTWRGRPALEWLDALVETNALAFEASVVFQENGTEAVPFLLSQIEKDSRGARPLEFARSELGSSNPITRVMERFYQPRIYKECYRRRIAVVILGKLGAAAEPAVPRLITMLERDIVHGVQDTILQANAIAALRQVAPTNFEGVRGTIKHVKSFLPDSALARAAYVSLEDLGPECQEVFPSLITSLRHRKQNQYLSDTSYRGPGLVQPDKYTQMTGLLPSTNAAVREGAAFYLHEQFSLNPEPLEDRRKQAPFVGGLSDPDANVRLLIAEMLGLAANPPIDSLLPVLEKLAQDPDYAIRLRAVDQLRRYAAAVPSARRLLDKIAERDASSTVRTWAGAKR